MTSRISKLAALALLAAASGCSPSGTSTAPPTQNEATSGLSQSESNPVAESAGSPEPGINMVPASVDAGMMADEFDRTQRLDPKKLQRSDGMIEINPRLEK